MDCWEFPRPSGDVPPHAPPYSRCRLRRDGGTGTGRCARVGKVDSDRIAIDGVLRLFLLRKLFLLGLCLSLRDVRGVLRCIRAIAIDRIALRGRHRLCPGGLWAGDTLFGLELLHRSGQLLLMLALLGVPLGLHLLLRRKTVYLLGIRRSGAHGHCACRGCFLVAAQQARHIGDADQGNDDNQAITTGIPFLSGDFASGCSGTVAGDSDLARSWLVRPSHAVKLDLLLADGEIAVVQLLRHGVQAGVEIEVDERALPSFSSYSAGVSWNWPRR
jgi:hypothetical protein